MTPSPDREGRHLCGPDYTAKHFPLLQPLTDGIEVALAIIAREAAHSGG